MPTTNPYARGVIAVFTLAMLTQGAHMIEHFAQLYQFVVLRMPAFESHGILFFLDLEWNHFSFNDLYFLFLAYVFVKAAFWSADSFAGRSQFPRYAFLLGFAIQGYHVLEHTSRIGQHLQTGCEPCPGILGWYFNGIYLHFTLNTVTWLLPMIAFFAYGYHKKIFPARTAPAVT